jgi:transcription elongation factor GreA
MSKVAYVSEGGLDALRIELRELVAAGRAEIAQRLHDAATMGDLTENADYESAKRDQAFLEGRIQMIEALLRDAVVIADPSSSEHVQVGSTVTIRSEDGDETYTIVGPHEARPAAGRISNDSPIGLAMLGKGVGDQIVARTPGGPFSFEIVVIA